MWSLSTFGRVSAVLASPAPKQFERQERCDRKRANRVSRQSIGSPQTAVVVRCAARTTVTGNGPVLRKLERFGDVKRAPSGRMPYLLATAKAVRDDHGVRIGCADGRHQDPF